MRYFEDLNKTNFDHHRGAVEIFNGELMAIAGGQLNGDKTRKVEIIRNGQWRNMTSVGNQDGKLYEFSSLTIHGNSSDILFVFGIHI